MDALEKYLTEEQPFNQRDINDIENLLTSAVKPYIRHFDSEKLAWPYKIVGDTPDYPKKGNDKGELSASTTAMILNSLLRLCNLFNDSNFDDLGNIPKSSIFPINLDAKKIKKPLLEKISIASKLLLAKIQEKKAVGNAFSTESGTYGTDDIFTLAWLAEVSQADWQSLGQDEALWKDVADFVILKAEYKLAHLDEDLFNPPNADVLEHAFTRLRLVQIVRRIKGKHHGALPDVYERFEKTLHEQLSFSSIPDSRFDPAELMFCLEGMLLCQKNVVDRTLFDRVLEVLESVQHENAYWRPVKPILATSQGLVLFPVSVEVANSLLRSCAIFDENSLHDTYGSKSIDLLRRYWQWLRARSVRNPVAGESEDIVGWHSEHVNDPTVIHLWESSQVIEFLIAYRNALQLHIARTTLVRSRFVYNPPAIPVHWAGEDGIEKRFESVTCLGAGLKVYEDIGNSFVTPHRNDQRAKSYSMLLYGPPGTGKTTLAENVANSLGRRLIKITVSDFLEGGGAKVEARAKNIFEVLTSQSSCVVLFDEIDHFLLDRDSKRYSEQDTLFQFMTPGMLTKFNDLRQKENVIFIISTNYEDRIDPAIKRIGRIDKKYLVLPPDQSRRIRMLSDLTNGGKDFESIPNGDQWKDLGNASVFLGFNDLRETVKMCSRKGNVTVSELHAKLESRARTIALEAYSSRFIDDKGNFLEAGQTPLHEFLCLVALRIEAGSDFNGQEKKVVGLAAQVIKKASDARSITAEAIMKYSPELEGNWPKKVADALNGGVAKWRLRFPLGSL